MFESYSRARRSTLGALLVVAATTMTACAHSQQAPPADSAAPRGHGDWQGSRMRHGQGPRGDRMLEGLNLTKDQRDQITLIRDRYKLHADSLRMGGEARDSSSRSAFRSLMEQQMREIRGVLNPDQQKQFDDRIAQMRERRQQNGGRGDYDRHNGQDEPSPDNQGGNPPPPPPAS
jgi:Spy/CpxP family protein refolding chaperone